MKPLLKLKKFKTSACIYNLRPNRNDCEKVKQAHRDMVVAHITKYLPANSPRLAYFGFPGKFWKTEKQLSRKFPTMQFCGVERDDAVVDACLANMPGCRIHEDIGPLRCERSGRCRLYVVDAGQFLRHCSAEQFNCAWLDFTGCFRRETMTACRELAAHVCPDTPFPFAFTCSIGRESTDETAYIHLLGGQQNSGLLVRASALQTVLAAATKPHRNVEISYIERYRSVTGQLMLFSMGIIH